MKAVGSSHVFKLGSITKTVDLPAFNSVAPAELDLTLDMVSAYFIRVSVNFRWTLAETTADAVINFTDKNKYFVGLGPTTYQFDCGNNNVKKLYIVSNAAVSSDGLSIQSLEFS